METHFVYWVSTRKRKASLMKKKYVWHHVVRFVIQIAAFFLIPGLFIQAFNGVGVLIQDLVKNNYSGLMVALFPTLFLFVFTLFFGRVFCGYLCSFGTLSDGMSFLGHNVFHLKTRMPAKVDHVLKYLKYVVLAVFLISFFFTPTLLGNADIWQSFGSIFVLPASFEAAFSTLLPGTILLAALLLVEVFYERFFCRYLCPLGAIFSILSLFRINKIHKERSKCGLCRVCTNACPMGIETYRYDVIKSGECIGCLDCVSACPRENPVMVFLNQRTRYWAMSVLAVTTIGLYYVGNIVTNNVFASSTSTTLSGVSGYADGVYEGSGTGFNGTIVLDVTIANGKITNITTVSSNDSSNQYSRAFSTLTSEIISSQSTDVNGVSGCTYSSNGIKEAVASALSKAASAYESIESESASSSASTSSSSSTSSTSSASSASGYKDGTYQGSGRGHGTTTLSVTISGGKITNITTVSTTDTMSYYNRAFPTVSSEIISSQSTSVQAVSGCTQSSRGIMTAVSNALSNAL
jgi:uncharacterized protein with FMN-binding domain/Pyruvate/2-oxoacid:ferredoxin oxidoreductase delta subunit